MTLSSTLESIPLSYDPWCLWNMIPGSPGFRIPGLEAWRGHTFFQPYEDLTFMSSLSIPGCPWNVGVGGSPMSFAPGTRAELTNQSYLKQHFPNSGSGPASWEGNCSAREGPCAWFHALLPLSRNSK